MNYKWWWNLTSFLGGMAQASEVALARLLSINAAENQMISAKGTFHRIIYLLWQSCMLYNFPLLLWKLILVLQWLLITICSYIIFIIGLHIIIDRTMVFFDNSTDQPLLQNIKLYYKKTNKLWEHQRPLKSYQFSSHFKIIVTRNSFHIS